MRYALGPVQDFCLIEKLPPLTALVVQKRTGRPGAGFIAWDVDDLAEAHRRVWAFDWDAVANPFARIEAADDLDSLATELIQTPSTSAAVFAKVPSRGVGQQVFRRALLKAYQCRCAFCGLSFSHALEAAHIWPWSKCAPHEKLDPANGVLLCSTHHKLFDADLLTFDSDLRIVYFDQAEEDGPYTDADRIMSIGLHKTSMIFPEDLRLRPRADLLTRRNDAGGWGDLAAY
ncbi:MAG: HNH endonuclease [Pseudomonadota bacterium]